MSAQSAETHFRNSVHPPALGCNADIGDWDGDGACDEGIEECRPAAEVHINGVANSTYFIVVDHAQLGGESNFSLTLSPGDCPNAPAPIECALDDHCEGDAICHNGQCLIAPAADAACGVDFLVELDGPGTYEGTTQGAPFRATGTCSNPIQRAKWPIEFDSQRRRRSA